MKLYRVVDDNHAKNNAGISGVGAGLYGGRWNNIGTNAVYTTDSIDVAVAEKAFYSLISRVNNKIVPTIGLSLLHLDYLAPPTFVDIFDQDRLQNELLAHNMKLRTLDESRFSPYELLPEVWTMNLGTQIMVGGAPGLVARSARSEQGKCIPIFPKNIPHNILVIRDREEIEISLANLRGEKWRKGQKIDLSKVILRNRMKENRTIEILNFPLSET